jgi:hypothetical protein
MGIDGIGKNGGVAPPAAPASGQVEKSGEATRKFEVSKSPPAAASAAAPEVAETALDRFRSGQIDLQGYLDAKVEEATSHLRGLPGDQLAAIRGALRERLATDPALIELVRQATGRDPEPVDL